MRTVSTFQVSNMGGNVMLSMDTPLTVAPAASSTLLKNSKPKELKWFDKVQEKYVKSLEWCFQHRWAPLGAAVVLLVFCGWRVKTGGLCAQR